MANTIRKDSLREIWREAQHEKRKFIHAVSDIELRFLRKHKLKRTDVCFVWLDELLIGVEVRDGRRSRVYYDEDLRQVRDLKNRKKNPLKELFGWGKDNKLTEKDLRATRKSI